MSAPVYVETTIRASMDDLWRATQTPELHTRWDARFSDIRHLPRESEAAPQKFLYRTRLGFGLDIAGEGETVGAREDAGARVSALKFGSGDWKSLIREGGGFWKYVPAGERVRFFTRYDYRVRFGWAGKWLDALVFRPLMGWATAWSFDRLRLWLEEGIDPAASLERACVHAAARATLAFVWVWHGLVPKLLYPDAVELSILWDSRALLAGFGVAEILFGLALVAFWRWRWMFLMNIFLLVVAGLWAALARPTMFLVAFQPLTLNLSLIALAFCGWLAARRAPFASRCLRMEPKS